MPTRLRSMRQASAKNSVRISGETRSGARTWDIPLAPVAGDVMIPALWAREKIRDIEENAMEASGSRQTGRQNNKTGRSIIEISKKYGIVSSETSYVGVEKRSESDKTTSGIALRKVPVALTNGWGGLFDRTAPKKSFPVSASMHSLSSRPPMEQYSVVSDADSRYDSAMDAFAPTAHEQKQKFNVRIPAFLRKHAGAPAVSDKKDFLLEIFSCQEANGGFDVDESLLKFADLPDLFDLAGITDWKRDAAKTKIVTTMLVLLVLEMQFGARRDEWEGVVRKSRAWLQKEMERTHLAMENQPLEQWLRKYLENKPAISRSASQHHDFFQT